MLLFYSNAYKQRAITLIRDVGTLFYSNAYKQRVITLIRDVGNATLPSDVAALMVRNIKGKVCDGKDHFIIGKSKYILKLSGLNFIILSTMKLG